MSKNYTRSIPKIDHVSTDIESSNIIKDIIIMLGIYKEFLTLNNHNVSFTTYYSQITHLADNYPANNFPKKTHYFNVGIKYFREIAKDKTISTSRRRLKKLCDTYRYHPISIPNNADAIFFCLFEIIFECKEWAIVFTQFLLNRCTLFTHELVRYPMDCNNNLLGFIYVFLTNIDNIAGYTEKHREFSTKLNTAMEKIITQYEIPSVCATRRRNL